MRLYFSGDEDVCKHHLPVVQARANEFAALTKKRGLQQNTTYINFDDTGAQAVVSYCFGQLNVGISAPYRGGESAKEVIERSRLYEWNFVFALGEVNGYGLGAFLSKEYIVVPVFKSGATVTLVELKSSDVSMYYDENFPLAGSRYNNIFGFGVTSKSLFTVLTRYNFTDVYSVLAAESGDILYSTIWTSSGYVPRMLPEKSGTVYFITGGDFTDDLVPEVVLPYTKSTQITRNARTQDSANGYSYFYIGSFFGTPPVFSSFYQIPFYGRGEEIYAELEGTQSLDGTYEVYDPTRLTVNKVRYNTDILITYKYNDAIISHREVLLDHAFSHYVDSNLSFFDETTNPRLAFPTCVNMVPYAAPRNVVLMCTVVDNGTDAVLVFFSPSLMLNTGLALYQLSNNVFVRNGASVVSNTVDVPMIISNILRWSYDCKRFIYKEVTFSIPDYLTRMGDITPTGKLLIYEITSVASMSVVFEITSYSASTIIWHSKNFDSLVIKGTPTQDGVYKREGSGYTKLFDFTDEEPVFLSDDGSIIAVKTKIHMDGVTYPCTECVGVFFDKAGYVDKLATDVFQIKTFAGTVVEETPAGVYNFFELSEDSSFCVLSKYYQGTDPGGNGNALVVDFADGPLHFEETNLKLSQSVTTVRQGRRYLGDAYIKPPWALYFSADETLIALRTKVLCVPYSDSFSFRSNILNNSFRRLKHFWHFKLGVFERLLQMRERIPDSLLNQETRTTVETEE